jgi:hypothetical protein
LHDSGNYREDDPDPETTELSMPIILMLPALMLGCVLFLRPFAVALPTP